ncbi:ricin-type beta-trefoil lectin domain protein [Solwaraspora sp. WMMD791]|uniref:RHS repeat-associated core domain-containing protein n=1 Tax=Solwaraspora sp. WMMD791 TaxID=3016086 RepID=UPI00249A5672|nr:RHS repeat-associated core domain-containing protein [Solwaraspora sp. WMMD791]WFE24849.1 ricin-type beta-trefoil lectin domain protein [Solwaraspora sp. WMMD791]
MRGTGPLSWQQGDRAARTGRGHTIRQRARRATLLLLTVVMTVTVLPAQAWAVPGPGMSREGLQVELPDLPQTPQLHQDESAESDLTTADEVPVVPYEPVAVTPWSSGDGTVDLTGVAPGETLPVDDLPVALGVPENGDPAALAGNWAVGLAAPEASQAAGVAGLIMKITPPASADPAAEVALTVDYTTFADLYGPQAADRFGFLLLPDCVYDDPDGGDCATGDGGVGERAGAQAGGSGVTDTGEITPIASQVAVESTRRVVSGTVPVGALLAASSDAGRSAASSTSSSVVGVLDTGASAAGDYTATPLLSSGSWAAGSSSGAFTYGYQIEVPEATGGLMPQVNLSYSSQSVDGRTSATNNQASWIGDGWDYAAGSITRSYANCRQDSTKAGSNNASHRTGDLCWGSNNATLSLGGMTTELVWDAGTWTTANGDGSRVELLTDAGLANGDADGEYWVVTTRDGTRHWFGRHRLPGWSTGDPVTNSVLTVPVYGNHAGEPCYQAGNWAGSACTQAWRWSLDYVEDVHGNAMSLWWAKETNYYARNFNFKDPVRYDRSGYLTRIDYGQRADSMYTAAPLARVSFTVAERCFAEGALTCTDANFTSTNPNNYRIWYDTPADLHCTAGQKCWNSSPAFFTRKRLDRITTSAQRQSGSTALQTVDEYRLKQSFPILRTGLNTALWLESVTRTGHGRDGAGTIALNAVRFEAHPDDMPNRVRRDDRPNFSRLRIGRVINEYGGETIVTYKQPTGACATGTGLPGKNDTAALKANTRLCYPSFWHPDPAVEDIDWFHKYVVDTVEELPAIDGAFPTVTRYSYADAGWKLAEQEFTKKSTRTYSQFAGFAKVTVVTGDDDPAIGSARTKSVTRYFRGMGDSVSVRDIDGTVIAADAEPFAGRIAEELTYTSADDADTAWLTRSVTVPAATELARRDRDDGLSPLRAWRVTEPRQVTYTRSSGTGDDTRTQRVVETRTTYESTYGLPTRVESLGDTGRTGDESCTNFGYVHRTDKHVIGLTRQVRTSPTLCADANFDDLTTLSAASRVGYDNQAYGAALTASTRALVTSSWSLKADGSGYQPDGTVAFDELGRVTSRTDPDGKTSTTTFEPATGQAYRVTERNSLGHSQTVEVDPGRGVAVRSTDPNGHVSQATYDPLGRLVEAWAPGRTPTAGAIPDFSAEYHLPAGKPPYVVTRSRGHENRVETTVTLYDGLGRERQSQQEAVGGGRLISDTLYNTSGEIWQTNNAYYADGAPSGRLFTPLADTTVPNATRYTYDGLGRVLTEMPVLRGTDAPERATRYEYGTDHSTVINPAGAPSYRVWSDAIGRTTRVDTFTDAARTAFTTMRYEHDARGQLARAYHSEALDHPWTWSYDQRGRLTAANDPDTGTTTIGYDHRDRPLTTTNARDVTVWNGYDELSRPVAQRLDGPAGTLLAEYSYDTAPGGTGLPATATRYTDGLAYTQQIGGYTDDYQPTSTTLTLPQEIADTWGLARSYTYSYSYTDTGLPASVRMPAVGRLPAEEVLVRYTADGLPLSVSGQDWYGAETVYSPYGQVLRSTLGAQPYRVWTTASYDDASGALLDQRVFREQTGDQAVVPGNLVSQRSYGYDAAGNVTAVREHATGIAERQCFSYDGVGQLTRAWTSADQSSCAAVPSAAMVASGADGAGYWQEYEYDLLGNRTRLVEKDLGGDVAKDATSTYTYGKLDGSQPRTLTSVRKQYVTLSGAQVTAEAKRLYEATGETKSVSSLQTGDAQTLSWTWDGQVERIAGQGQGGKTAWVGPAGHCLDLAYGLAVPGQRIQLHSCNRTPPQRWAFTVAPGQVDADLGSMRVYDDWCLQPVGTTAGSLVQLQRCDDGAGQRLTRTAVGQLQHVVSGLCLATLGGATANATPIVLATCDAGATAQLWSAQDETRHVYGPDGARLLTVQDAQATLHLGDALLTVAAGGVNVVSQRTYPVPGGAVMRYAYGTSPAALAALASDHQGSPYAEVNSSAGMPVRIVKRDPYGNERATTPLAVNLQTHTGFLGATRDDSSGYTPLGARLYDPAVGRFLSADPVLDLADPAQANGYTYAHNNPVTHSDPTGLSISLTSSERAAALAGAGLSAAQVAQARSAAGRTMTSVILSVAWDVLKEFIGLNAALGCFGGSVWSCVDLVTEFIPAVKMFKAFSRIVKAVERTFSAIKAWQKAKAAAQSVLRAARAAETAALNAKKAAAERAKRAAQALAKKAADKANTTSNKAVNASKKTGNPVQKQAQAKTNPKASSGGGGRASGGGGKNTSKPGGTTGASSRSNGGSSGGGGGGETYYRTMSQEHFDILDSGGGISATRETFISPTQAFSEAYEGVLVRFTVEEGTTAALESIGVRNNSAVTARRYPGMPLVMRGWRNKFAFFKGEGAGHINIGLGGGTALKIFNKAITNFEKVR